MILEIKYRVGRKVWAIYNNKPQEFTIESADIHVSLNYDTMEPHSPSARYRLRIGESAGHRLELYEFELDNNYLPTKEELLNSL